MKVFFKHVTIFLCGFFILSTCLSCASFSEAKRKKREKWIFDNYKDQIKEFPQNELLTKEELDVFFKDSSDFVLKHIR